MKRKKLKHYKTRWVEKVDSSKILSFVAVNEEGHWNNESVTLASNLLHRISTFEFVITLEVVKTLMGYLRSLAVRSQEEGCEISNMYMHVNTAKSQLNKIREMIDTKHNIYVAEENEIPVEKNIKF